jgi:hypothetical protein
MMRNAGKRVFLPEEPPHEHCNKEREEHAPGGLIEFRARGKECSGTSRWSFYERMSHIAISKGFPIDTMSFGVMTMGEMVQEILGAYLDVVLSKPAPIRYIF